MPSRLSDKPIAVSVGMLWLMAGAALGALSLDVSPAFAKVAVLLASLGGTWFLLVMVGRPQSEADAELRARTESISRLAGLGPGGTPGEASARLARAEAALSASMLAMRTRSENWRAVLDGVNEPVLATGPDGRVLLLNAAATRFFRARGGADGLRIDDLIAQPELLAMHAAALQGRAQMRQVKIPRPAGMRTFQVEAAPVRLTPEGAGGGPGPGEGRAGVVITLRDVTELATAAQLKTDFVANASHELRTPLASIRAAVETLAEQAKDDPASLDWLIGKIVTNVGRLEEMTRDLLDLARLESPEVPVEIVPVRAAELADSLTEVFDSACRERRLALRFDLDPALDRLKTDPRLLTLILKNLVDNATKFAFEGTTILVVGRTLGPDPRQPAGGEGPPLQGARFEVTDQGVGIPIDQQARIFERFYQVDTSRAGLQPRRGTGLGLAIVKHAVKALGGNVGVRSVWQQGTTITVELPGCVEPDRPAAAPAA